MPRVKAFFPNDRHTSRESQARQTKLGIVAQDTRPPVGFAGRAIGSDETNAVRTDPKAHRRPGTVRSQLPARAIASGKTRQFARPHPILRKC